MGARRYCLEDIQDLLHRRDNPPEKKKICYCRVSSSKQMDDLERQENYFRSIYPGHQLVTDIGSGINWKRKGLQAILEQAMSGIISEIVVAHRDRLCRFAFELLESIFSRCQVKLVVLDAQEHQSSDSDLADDILSIIHIYSCRSMGKRRHQNKKDKDLSDCSSENHHDAMDGTRRYVYNKTLHAVKTKKDRLNAYELRNKYVTAKNNPEIQSWELNTPKDIRAGAIRDLEKNFKSALSLLKTGHIRHFKMSYCRKKDTPSIEIPKSALKWDSETEPL
jgi:predicted site-specific integrase-resolvase